MRKISMVDYIHDNSLASRTAGYKKPGQPVSIQRWQSSHKTTNLSPQLETRTAGPIPGQTQTSTAKQEIAQNLSQADEQPSDFKTALTYAQQSPAEQEDSYSFDDILDIVNPLHHLPIIGYAYRELTGDTIKPASQLIGGTLFGGPVGAVTGAVNFVVEHETGKDVTENLVSMVMPDKKPETNFAEIQNDPEKRLNDIVIKLADNNPAPVLPNNALSLTPTTNENRYNFKSVPIADGRTAGSRIVKEPIVQTNFNQPRDLITEVTLSSMPRVEDY